MITRNLVKAYNPNWWIGRSGKASWYPNTVQFKVRGGQLPAGALQNGALIVGGAQMINPVKPRLMMDPSDPSTWQRPYRFTGGMIG